MENVEFLTGEIEAIPLPEAAVDVIISNCVINLSADKRKVLAEAFRVLRPGGRFAVSDVVFRGEVPEALKRNVELWIGCVAGALQETEYRSLLAEVGFEEIEVEPTRIYRSEDARAFLQEAGIDPAGVRRIFSPGAKSRWSLRRGRRSAMKSYGRAPTFLLLTGYKQVRSVAAALAGDWESAREVQLTLPKTGACSRPPVLGVPVAAGCSTAPTAATV